MTAEMPTYTISHRVRRFWKTFSDYYGADVIGKHFGAIPPQDWCELVDEITTRDAMDRVLADMRNKHVTFPPRFPEFDALVARVTRPVVHNGPSNADRLTQFVLRTKPLTRNQLIGGTWQYLYRGNPRTGEGLETIGLEIAADGDAPGYRVMVADLALQSEPDLF